MQQYLRLMTHNTYQPLLFIEWNCSSEICLVFFLICRSCLWCFWCFLFLLVLDFEVVVLGYHLLHMLFFWAASLSPPEFLPLWFHLFLCWLCNLFLNVSVLWSAYSSLIYSVHLFSAWFFSMSTFPCLSFIAVDCDLLMLFPLKSFTFWWNPGLCCLSSSSSSLHRLLKCSFFAHLLYLLF